MTAAWAWLCASRLGRGVVAIVAAIGALLIFSKWQQREGEKHAEQKQRDADHAALAKADKADSSYRADGAVERLRQGRF